MYNVFNVCLWKQIVLSKAKLQPKEFSPFVILFLLQIYASLNSTANLLWCCVQKQRVLLTLRRSRRNILYCHVESKTNKDCWIGRCMAEIVGKNLDTRLGDRYAYSCFEPNIRSPGDTENEFDTPTRGLQGWLLPHTYRIKNTLRFLAKDPHVSACYGESSRRLVRRGPPPPQGGGVEGPNLKYKHELYLASKLP